MERYATDIASLEITSGPIRFTLAHDTVSLEGKWNVQKHSLPLDPPAQLSFDYMVSIGQSNYMIHPDDIADITDALKDVDGGDGREYTFRVIDAAGYVSTVAGSAARAVHVHMDADTLSWHSDVTPSPLDTPDVRHTLDVMRQAYYTLDWDGRVTFANPKAAELLGLAVEDITGKNIWTILPEAMNTAFYEAIQVQAINNRQHAQVQYLSNVLDKWVLLNAAPIADGCAVLCTVIKDEATGGIQRENERRTLVDKNALLEAVAQSQLVSLNVLKAVRDEHGQIVDLEWTFANAASEAFAGGKKLIGQRYLSVFPGVEQTGILDVFRRVIQTGEPNDHEFSYSDDGLTSWFRSVAVKLGDGVLVTGEDITPRKRAEQELIEVKDELARRATNRYLELVKNMQQAFCIVEVIFDKEGNAHDYRFLETNPAFEKQSKLKNAVGKTMRQFQPNHEDVWFHTYGDVVKNQQSIHFVQHARSIGDLWFDVFALPTGPPASNKVAIFFTDITARKRAERNLAFLTEIQDDFAALTTAQDIMRVVGAKVSNYLHVSLGYLTGMSLGSEEITLYAHADTREDSEAQQLPTTYNIREFVNNEVMQAWGDGEAIVVCDVAADPRVNAEAYAALNIFSFISIPYQQRQCVNALMVANDNKVRDWRDDEIALFRELSNRIFPRLERARAEEALRESEEKFRSLFDAMVEGYVLVEVLFNEHDQPNDIRYLEANAAAVEMAGTDLVGRRTRELTAIDDSTYDIFGRVARTGVSEHHELNAEPHNAIFHYYIFKVGLPQENKVAAVYHDITQRKMAEQQMKEFSVQLEQEVSIRTAELKESKDLLQSLFDSTANGFSILQAVRDDAHKIVDFEYRFVNKTTELVNKRYDLVGKLYSEVHTGFKPTGLFDNLKAVVETGQNGTMELYYDREGFQNWFSTSAVKFGDGVVLSFEDITARKEAEQELSKNFEIMRQSEMVAGLGSWEYVVDTGEYKWSAGMYRLFDLPPGEQITPEIYTKYVVPGDEHVAERITTFFKHDHAPIDVVLPIKTQHHVKCVKVKGVPMTDERGKVVRLIGIDHDITAQEQSRRVLEELNESLQQKNAKLKSMNQELSNFAFITSHDLREPLRKIKTFSNFLMERETTTLSERGTEYCLKIVHAVDRMNALIDDILTFSKASAVEPKLVPVNLDKVLVDVLADLSELILEHNAMVTSDPLPVMMGNALQLSQLLQNLISNGIKFQRPGSTPRVSITSTTVRGSEVDSPQATPSREYLLLKVSDNGIGFDERYADRIFQMFQRLHSQTEYQGTGMGLAICKRVVENHKGFIQAKGNPGEGATFFCYFPLSSDTPE